MESVLLVVAPAGALRNLLVATLQLHGYTVSATAEDAAAARIIHLEEPALVLTADADTTARVRALLLPAQEETPVVDLPARAGLWQGEERIGLPDLERWMASVMERVNREVPPPLPP